MSSSFICLASFLCLLSVISLNLLWISRFGFGFSFCTGLLVVSTTFVISEFDSVWPKNNFCSLAHKDWPSLSISYNVVFYITWHFYWNLRGCFQASSQVINNFPVLYTLFIANVSQAFLLKTFVFPQKVFSSSKTLKFEKNFKFVHPQN